jgi:hypothetical protein
MKLQKCKVAATAAVLSALLATGASATTVTLSKQNPADVFNGGGKAVVSGITNRSGSFYAGGFRVTDGDRDFVAWCLDILDNLGLPSLYEITTTPFAGTAQGSLGATVISNIENLFEVNYATLVDIGNNAQSAGFQLALWELVYETGGTFNVSDGTWRATSSTSGVVAAANTYLANLGNAITQNYALTFYESKAGGQNLVSVSPVPLPSAVWLFGLGLAGLYGAGRRRNARA